MIYCGIDWAEHHHDVALVDDTGMLLAKRRISEDAAGYRALLDLLAEYGDSLQEPIPVAIETSRGLLVAALRQTDRPLFAINPLAVARYRDRHSVSGKKSDAGDALVLANILRTDQAMHRHLPNDSELARAVGVLARAQQDAVCNRQQMANQLRSLLREYYPAALEAFGRWKNGLCRPETRELLALATTPTMAARLSVAQIRAALKRAGRTRGVDTEAQRLREIFRGEYAHQPPLVEAALGRQMRALVRQLSAACIAADELADAVEETFPTHPDARIIMSFPGLGPQTGARVLAEIGDDRERFTDARALKAYAGSSPVTRASGTKEHISRRRIKNDRLNHAGYLWAFSALRTSPGAEAHYRRRRERGDWHAQAQRHLFNRMLGQLFCCLQKNQPFDEHKAFSANVEVATALTP